MPLIPLTEKDYEPAAEALAGHWKERGMDVYDKEWAMAYLRQGHQRDVISDHFFLYKDEHHHHVGIVSLLRYEGDVAEIRDEIVFSQRDKKRSLEHMLQAVVRRARGEGIRKLYSYSLYQHLSTYMALGFQQEGVLKDHFKTGENLVIMSLFP